MRQITVSDEVFFDLREVGPAVGHDVKAVGEIGDVAVHMVGQKDAFGRPLLQDQSLERGDMQGRDLRKRLVEQYEPRGAAQDQVTLQNPPFAARHRVHLGSEQFFEERKPFQQVAARHVVIPQHPVQRQPAGNETLLRQVTHFVGPETVVPHAVDAHRPETGPQGAAENLHQTALAAAVAAQNGRDAARLDRQIYARKDTPVAERQFDRVDFEGMFFRGVHTGTGPSVSTIRNTR